MVMAPDQPDKLIHQPVRTRIMAALAPLDGAPLEFRDLRELSGATDGNLGSHITALESGGYVRVIKDFKGKRPRTRVVLTPTGKQAFETYRHYLRSLLEES